MKEIVEIIARALLDEPDFVSVSKVDGKHQYSNSEWPKQISAR